MRDVPVIMSAPMVLATLREIEKPGTGKTMTRRLRWMGSLAADGVGMRQSAWCRVKPGDKLWVRESFWALGRWIVEKRAGNPRYTLVRDPKSGILFAADEPSLVGPKGKFSETELAWHLRPSIFLPREESRLTLIVTATKIERLKMISDDDALAEGIERARDGRHDTHVPGNRFTARAAFRDLWNSLHGAGAWDANPEVVAITFRPVLANVDTSKEAA